MPFTVHGLFFSVFIANLQKLVKAQNELLNSGDNKQQSGPLVVMLSPYSESTEHKDCVLFAKQLYSK